MPSGGIQLIELIRSYGGEPASGGTATGAMHRGLVQAKASVGAEDELSILESASAGKTPALRAIGRPSHRICRLTSVK